MSVNGWTARELCERWFLTVFVPIALARRICPEKPIVLTLDGHDTHETPAMKRIAYENNIIIYCFPSKTTHKLQPLDVVVFSAVQRAWSSHCDEQVAFGVTIDRYNIVHEYVKIRGVITPDLIRKSFEKTGIYPFNPAIFTDADYAPSMASSTIAHVPSSFPPEIQSSPPARLSDIDESDTDSDYEQSLDFMYEDEDGHHGPGIGTEDSDDNQSNQNCGEVGPIGDDSDEEITRPTSPLAVHTWDSENPLSPVLPSSPTPPSPRQAPQIPSHHPLCDTMTPPSPPLDAPATNTRSHSRSTSTINSELDGITRATTVLSRKPDWQKSFPELLSELNDLRSQVRHKDAELLAANAHCTIIQRGMADANKQIENLTKKKTRTSTKVKARFGTLPELKAAFEEEEAQRLERERLNAEKDAQKTAETVARNTRIATDSVLRTFDNSLSAYKRKDDLLTIASALEIVTTGTVPQLTARIKDHLHTHPDLASNPRFAGLFKQGSRRYAPYGNKPGSHSEPTVTVPAASLLPTPLHSSSYSSSVPLNQQFYDNLSLFAGSSHNA